MLSLYRAATTLGFSSKRSTLLTNSSISQLRVFLASGLLPIVLLQEWSPNATTTPYGLIWDSPQFAVVIGVSDSTVVLMDPFIGDNGFIPRAEFVASRWHGVDSAVQQQEGHTFRSICSRCVVALGMEPSSGLTLKQRLPPYTLTPIR
jgi:hypothetical protein